MARGRASTRPPRGRPVSHRMAVAPPRPSPPHGQSLQQRHSAGSGQSTAVARAPPEFANTLDGHGQRHMHSGGSSVAPRIDGPGSAFRPAMGKMPMIMGSMSSNMLANVWKLSRIIRNGTDQTSNETQNECNGVKNQDTPIALNTDSRRAGAEQPA